MTTLNLHRKTANPYYIYAPNYRETSSGICVMHYLCHALNIAGHEAYVAMCDVVNPNLRTPLLTYEIMDRHKQADLIPITVYPEVVEGNPLNGPVVVRYILNREGFVSGNSLQADEDDLFFHYAHDFRQEGIDANMLTLPVIDSELFSPPAEPVVRTKNYLYINRFPLKYVDFSLLPTDVEVLSLSNPKTLAQLATVFKTAAVLYSYEISATCTEAMLCGCPVIYLKGGHIKCLPFTEHFGEAGSAMYDEPGGLERARETVLEARNRWLEIETTFWTQLDHFLTLTQQAVQHYRESIHTRRLRDWLKARTPSPAQTQLIDKHRTGFQKPTRVLVIVINKADDTQGLNATLASLAAWHSQSTEFRQVVVSGTTRPSDLSPAVEWRPYAHDRAAMLNNLLEMDNSDWFTLLNAGDELLSSGALMLDLQLPGAVQHQMVYFDEVHRNDKSLGLALRPDLNLDYLLSFPILLAGHWLFHRQHALDVGGFDNAFPQALEFDLILRLIERDGLKIVGHIDEPLLICASPDLEYNPDEIGTLQRHLKARGYPQGDVIESPQRHYHLQYGHTEQPLVSIVIPTRDKLPMLMRCVESLLEKTTYQHYEILIVDNDSQQPETLQWLADMEVIGGQKIRVMRYPHPFNFSAINNLAMLEARGEYLILLNNDTAILHNDWIDQLLNHAQRPEVGIVGAKLLFRDTTVQHAGVITGLRGPADHPFMREPTNAPGYMQRKLVDQNYSAVTAACMMIRKSVYQDVGGMDEEHFKVAYNDVDLCLKVGALGYLTVWTPHATLLHDGTGSQNVDTPDLDENRNHGRDAMYAKWLSTLARDPAYNSNLSLNGGGFELETNNNLTWRPLSWHPLPVVLAHPADGLQSGNDRVTMPMTAMREACLVDGFTSQSTLQVIDLERYNPDAIIFHCHLDDQRLEVMQRAKAFSRSFKVFDLDKHLLNLPTESSYGKDLPHDLMTALTKGLSFVDRFIVSTPYMADVFSGLHSDMLIVENRLSPTLWQGLQSQRQSGRKLRVGCLADDDLFLIEDIIKKLANDVDWIFIHTCPDHLRSYAYEVHEGISPERYPAVLAALNLDLALVPMKQSVFNDCKSNLRLLEYGACGIPVICSDVPAYQGDLSVTRVKNSNNEWLDAVHSYIHNPEQSVRRADALRAQVLNEWLLDTHNVLAWRDAWLS